MRISTIVPTKDRAKSLLLTLEVLVKQLKDGDEIIVVDNNSIDYTKKVVDVLKKKHPLSKIIYRFEHNLGPSYARNQGIELSSGDILAFLDDDCIVNKNWLRNIKNFYSLNHKNHNIVLQGKIIHKTKENNILHQILILKNRYSLEVLKNTQTDNCINYINAGNFACTRQVVNKYSKFFDEKNFPFICEERELAQRLNFDGFLIKLFEGMLVIHQKQRKSILESFVIGYKYGFFTGKIIKKFRPNDKIYKLFKAEIRDKFQRNMFKEIIYITLKIKVNYFKKIMIFILLIFKEFVYRVGLLFGKNSRLY